MKFNFAIATDIGRKRTQNQDNVGARPELGLYMVADGMGGHRGGETASAMAVEAVTSTVERAAKQENWNERAVLIEAVQAANNSIYSKALNQPELHGMGTTATVLLFRNNKLLIGHVGDSRCYFMRAGSIWQATRDHSLVQEKLRAGLITRDEVKTDRMRNVITRSVGFEPQVNTEVYMKDIAPGDIYLICSDGLSGLVEDKNVLELVDKNLVQDHDIDAAVKSLIVAANNNGGDDNISAVMVEVLPEA